MSITLAQLEQETGRRCGPFYIQLADRQVPSTATFGYVNMPELRSNVDQDLVTNMWLLRRGKTYDGGTVDMDIFDRQRTVSTYDPEPGRIFPDRPWQTICAAGEIIEFQHLDPAQQLRPAVLAGLRRCFLPDTVQAQPTAGYGGTDLTEQFPWLTEAWQVQRVRYGWLSPYGDAPWDTYTSMGHLVLTGTYGSALPMAVWVDAWRPAWSLVNGVDSDGPTEDDDVLEVDLDYAASAAHIEAWHLSPARMFQAAAGSTQATQTMAAQEFTRQAAIHGPSRPTDYGFQTVVRVAGGGGGWVNGPW